MFNLVTRAAVCLSALLLLALFTLPGRYLTRCSAEMEAGFAAVEEAAAAGDTALARRAAESQHARAPQAARAGGERTGDGDALLLAAGQLGWPLGQGVFQTEARE